MTPTEKAEKLNKFILWAQGLKHVKSAPVLTPELRQACEIAAEELVYHLIRASENSKIAQIKGAQGGRPKTDTPSPGTIRSRRSREKRKVGP